MKEEVKLNDNLNSKIVKIVNLDGDKYEVYFDFLKIPVQVNKDYLNTILHTEMQENQPEMHL